ncbi:hypothetical protein EAO73_35100 [Streptomyces sp. col6]|uniref:DUF6207 family protein n=1 Tax=Streptomyces sp. col6 TaxID=2478958 RepID=UPI0011CDD1BB|nr:DUF6207 family protein [Streptomyces sp. col6]TXR94510.1 hypothetical protein EAO73_35100 [Streptomyces sp. col6]
MARHLSEPGTGYVDIVAADEPAVLQIAELLAQTWTSSGPPTVRHLPEQAAFTGRVHLDTSLPAPGKTRVLPADWVRYPFPPWGGRLDGAKPTCLRRRRNHQACERQAAEWPRGYGADDPGACWSHLSKDEQEECLRVRQMYREAFWALKEQHQQEAGHGRDERCSHCTWSPGTGPQPAF